MSHKLIAEKHSASCFLNSLFREWSEYQFDEKSWSFVIELEQDESLIIPLLHFSFVGRHEYAQDFFLKKKDKTATLDFFSMVEILLHHLSKTYQTSSEQMKTFIERIKDSAANIEVALEMRGAELEELYRKDSLHFSEGEQALIVGHTFHPHPKNRDEFSFDDYKKYAPETAGAFKLHWFLVDPQILHQQVSKNFPEKKWAKEIFINEFSADSLKNGFIPYPVHPWQKNVLLNLPLIQEYLSAGKIIDHGESYNEDPWIPTSSLRSIYKEVSPYMLKFSLSVRLTNSIRHLLPLEVVRGLQVMDVFSTRQGESFLKDHPNFKVIYEPAFMALVDQDQKIVNETIVALRMNPFSSKNSSQKLVLATLTQDHPLEGMSMIGRMIANENKKRIHSQHELAYSWFNLFVEKALKPLMMAQANYGIYLGAHQQNLILEIKDNMPSGAYFRDCQGTGYSQIGFDLFSAKVDLMTRDNGNVLDEKMGNYLFSYYLIINSTFNVVSTLAADTGVTEVSLLKILREHLEEWRRAGVKDSSCLDYLLDQKELMQKGNFLCSFINMNENTTTNPLSIYNPIPNPIYFCVERAYAD
jgi:N2-citryl-N6-acetyl-N6-hydroxylysine synthase